MDLCFLYSNFINYFYDFFFEKGFFFLVKTKNTKKVPLQFPLKSKSKKSKTKYNQKLKRLYRKFSRCNFQFFEFVFWFCCRVTKPTNELIDVRGSKRTHSVFYTNFFRSWSTFSRYFIRSNFSSRIS